MRVGRNDRIVLSREVNATVIAFPRSDSPFRRVDVSLSTEPGTLRATIRLDFRGRPISPSHCWSYLPPAMTVRLYPR